MKYAGMRAASNVLLRDVNTSLIIEEMYRGTNVIYADFTDYDELAHHCGPERVESFEALDGVDRAIAPGRRPRRPPAIHHRPLDHGQSRRPSSALRRELGECCAAHSGQASDPDEDQRGSVFATTLGDHQEQAGPSRAAPKGKMTDGVVDLDAEELPVVMPVHRGRIGQPGLLHRHDHA
jgi:hypothetical protein